MIVTTTTSLEGKPVGQHVGVVTGETIVGGTMLMVTASGTAAIVEE
jgi:uncharacterized protein YbjQ (UPF0145 family)